MVTLKMLVLSVQVSLYPPVGVDMTLTRTMTFTLTLILSSIYNEEGIFANI